MNSEQWQRAKALFQAALERPESQRHAFLNEACGGDAELRTEVESLLSHAFLADNEIRAAVVNAAEELPETPHGSEIGSKIGPVEISMFFG